MGIFKDLSSPLKQAFLAGASLLIADSISQIAGGEIS